MKVSAEHRAQLYRELHVQARILLHLIANDDSTIAAEAESFARRFQLYEEAHVTDRQAMTIVFDPEAYEWAATCYRQLADYSLTVDVLLRDGERFTADVNRAFYSDEDGQLKVVIGGRTLDALEDIKHIVVL